MFDNDDFRNVFGRKPIFGMIHLAGEKPVKRAMEELAIFEEEGLTGAIIENYYGYVEDVEATLKEASKKISGLSLGVNILPNQFDKAFMLARSYGAKFIQVDHVSGSYNHVPSFNVAYYDLCRMAVPPVSVLGGVWPKYYTPVRGSSLEEDLKVALNRAEAIVVTGEGTGIEVSMEKILFFRQVIGRQPLLVGAGLTPANAYQQLCVADGAIVGTSLKEGDDTRNPVSRLKVRELMSVVSAAKAYQESCGVR